ncbi:hypothetical protein KJ359_008022 [Pestalotiopsis sp. 9143b]|nr:hypothetical protein KJ359_008022 [Pestalotiopsis sp. 9143b]
MAKLPGDWITIFTDIPYRYHVVKGNRPRWVQSLHEKYGPVVRISPTEACFQDLSTTREMYRVKGEYLKGKFYDQLANGQVSVFSTRDVEVHKRQRRLLSSEMSESSLQKHLPVVEAKVRLAIQRMEEEMQQRKATDVFHWFLSMATDVIGELSFGKSFDMLETGGKSEYIENLQQVAKIGSIISTFPVLAKLSKFVQIPIVSQATEKRRKITGYAQESIERHQRIVDEQGDDAKPTLLSKLYKSAGTEKLTFTEVRDNASAYIIAGSDTTANTLTYLVWLVCRNPDVKARLLSELQTLPDGFAYDDVKNLTYMNHVIEESLRMFPAAPSGLPRVVPAGGAQLSGHYLPAGCVVSAQAWSMHRHPDIFPDPHRFDPARWESPTKDMRDAFLAFGGGSRVCLGLHLARMELRLATARFFTTFPNAQVSTLEGFGDEEMNPKMFFLLTPSKHRCLIEAC